MHEKVEHLFAQKPKITSSTIKSSPSDSLQCKFLYPDIYKQHYQ